MIFLDVIVRILLYKKIFSSCRPLYDTLFTSTEFIKKLRYIMKYSLLLFDLDQTLFDTDKNAENALKQLNLPFDFPFTEEQVDYWHHLQQQMWADLELGKMTRQQLVDTRFLRYFEHFGIAADALDCEQQFEKVFFAEHALMPYTQELLTTLSKQYQLAVISNGTRAKQEQQLRDSKIDHFFDKVYLAGEVGFSKPDINFFQAITQSQPEVNKSEMLVIGDSLTADIKGANNFQIDSIWFNPHQLTASDIKPTYEVNELKQITDIL